MSKVKIKYSFTFQGSHYSTGEIHDAKDIPKCCKDLTEEFSSDDLQHSSDDLESSDELKNKIMSRKDLKTKN